MFRPECHNCKATEYVQNISLVSQLPDSHSKYSQNVRHGNELVINHAPFSRTIVRTHTHRTTLKAQLSSFVASDSEDETEIAPSFTVTTATLNPFEFSLSAGIRESFQTSSIIDLSLVVYAIILANFAVVIPRDNVLNAPVAIGR